MSIEGLEHGVAINREASGGYQVQLPYNRKLNNLVVVAGGRFDPVADSWTVPSANAAAFEKLAPELRKVAAEITKDEGKAKDAAVKEAKKLAKKEGVTVGGEAQFRDYIEREKPIFGHVVARNENFAVQLTGFGSQDGAPFLRVHNLTNFDDDAKSHLEKGAYVQVTYDQKMQARVEDAERTTAVERLARSLGEKVDGVKVERLDSDRVSVQFGFNEPLQFRLRKGAPDAQFDKERAAYVIAAPEKDAARLEALANTVSGMRREFVAQEREKEYIRDDLAGWMDKAPDVRSANTRDGTKTTGSVVAITDRFVAQTAGRDSVVLHHKGALTREGVDQADPKVDRNERVDITYAKGRGKVEPARERERPAPSAREVER